MWGGGVYFSVQLTVHHRGKPEQGAQGRSLEAEPGSWGRDHGGVLFAGLCPQGLAQSAFLCRPGLLLRAGIANSGTGTLTSILSQEKCPAHKAFLQANQIGAFSQQTPSSQVFQFVSCWWKPIRPQTFLFKSLWRQQVSKEGPQVWTNTSYWAVLKQTTFLPPVDHYSSGHLGCIDCCVWKTHFPWCHLPLVTLRIFLSPLP